MAPAAQMLAMPNSGVAAGHLAGQGRDDAAAGRGSGVPDAKDQEPEGTRSFIIDYGDDVLPAFVSDPWRKPLNVSVCRFGVAGGTRGEATYAGRIDTRDIRRTRCIR